MEIALIILVIGVVFAINGKSESSINKEKVKAVLLEIEKGFKEKETKIKKLEKRVVALEKKLDLKTKKAKEQESGTTSNVVEVQH